jgi:hypothetical protein
MLDEEVEKEIIEEKRVCVVDQCSTIIRVEQTPSPPSRSPRKRDHPKERFEGRQRKDLRVGLWARNYQVNQKILRIQPLLED